MNKTIIASLISLAFSPVTFAAETDIQADDVIVTASRISQPLGSVIADVTVVDHETIERAGQSTLVELLAMQPGVEISSNGGAGKTTSVYLRGSNDTHVVVLIDGLRVGSATAGTTALENIPLAQIDKIEILRGPATSLYGQDAIGGVIQIFTKKGEGSVKTSVSAGYGSYNTKTGSAGITGSVSDTSFALNASSYHTDGFSALKTNNPLFNDNDSYGNLAFTGSITQKLAEGHDIGIQLYTSNGHNDFDNRFNTTNFSDHAKLSQLSYAIVSHDHFTSNWLSTLKLGQGIDDSKSYQSFGNSRFKTTQNQYSWQNDVNLPVGTLTLLYDRLEQHISSDTIFDKTTRNTDGLMAGYLVNFGAHSLQANYRSDHSSQFGTHGTGGLGYGYSFNQNWRATGSYGTAFKAPTFNDLYFPSSVGFAPASNPNLKPEESRNFEAGLRYEDSASAASITTYQNRIKNLIQLDQNFTPFNSSDVLIKGITLAGSQQWQDWQLKGSADFLSPRNESTQNLLARRAESFGNLGLSRTWDAWRFGSELTGSGMRFNDSANTTRLGGYALLNFTADYKINQDWKLQARANNVLDKNYALAKDGAYFYQTPGANVFLSVSYSPVN